MRRRSGLMAVSVMRCSCLNGGCQSPILRQDAAGLEAARILSPSKARALESKAAPGPAAFYRVSGFVLWHFPVQCIGRADNVLEGHYLKDCASIRPETALARRTVGYRHQGQSFCMLR